MNGSSCVLAKTLEITEAQIRKLSISQVDCLTKLTKSRIPIEFQDAIKLGTSNILDCIRSETTAGGSGSEVHWCYVQAALSKLNVNTAKMPLKEHRLFLGGISKNPQSKIVSIPILIALFKYWVKSLSGDEFQTTNIDNYSKTSLQSIVVSLRVFIPNLLYVFALILDRANCLPDKSLLGSFVSVTSFKRLLARMDILLSHSDFTIFVNCLQCNGLSNSSGELDMKGIIDVAMCLQETMQSKVTSMDLFDYSAMESLMRKLQTSFQAIHLELLKRGSTLYIEKTALLESLRSVGIMLSASDMKEFWHFLFLKCRGAHTHPLPPHPNSPTTQQADVIDAELFNELMYSPSRKSSMHSIMRDAPAPRLRKEVLDVSSSNIAATIQQEPYALPPPPPSIHGTTSHHRAVSRCRHHRVENANETTQQMLPWQVNESTNNSNLKRRVRGQAQKLSSLELIACYRIIFNCLNKKSEILTRASAAEGIAALGLRLSKSDLDSLWSELHLESQSRPKISSFFQWIGIDDHIISQIQEYAHSSEIRLKDDNSTVINGPQFESPIKMEATSSKCRNVHNAHRDNNLTSNHDVVDTFPMNNSKFPTMSDVPHISRFVQAEASLEDVNCTETSPNSKERYRKEEEALIQPTVTIPQDLNTLTPPYSSNIELNREKARPGPIFVLEDQHDPQYMLGNANDTPVHQHERIFEFISPTSFQTLSKPTRSPLGAVSHTQSSNMKSLLVDVALNQRNEHNIENIHRHNINNGHQNKESKIKHSPSELSGKMSTTINEKAVSAISDRTDIFDRGKVPIQDDVLEGPVSVDILDALIDAVDVLQRNRPALALVFRRLLRQGGLLDGAVSCRAFAQALTSSPLSLSISPSCAWRLVCDMAGIPPTSDPESSRVLFSDINRFLDSQLYPPSLVQIPLSGEETTESLPASFRQLGLTLTETQTFLSIRNKLIVSKEVCGEKLKLMALTPRLRLRLKAKGERKKSADTWDTPPDFCTPIEISKLFSAVVDVSLQVQEALLICKKALELQSKESRESIGSSEPLVSIASVVILLTKLLE